MDKRAPFSRHKIQYEDPTELDAAYLGEAESRGPSM
jgi:hypothetical protein